MCCQRRIDSMHRDFHAAMRAREAKRTASAAGLKNTPCVKVKCMLLH